MKNPHQAMSMQWKMRWGHDFPKDKGEGMLTLSQCGKNPCVMGKTHQNYQLPLFLSFFPTIYFCQKEVEVFVAWKGKSMGNSNWEEHLVLNIVFWLHGQENTQNCMPFPYVCVFHLPSRLGGSRGDFFSSFILHSWGYCRKLNHPEFLSFTFQFSFPSVHA